MSGCGEAPEPPRKDEPYFKPGEYGGEPMDSTEHLYNLQLSPDGQQMAFIRAYTPGRPLDPRDQLWISNADGTDPQLIGYNIGTVDWSPDGQELAITFIIGFHDTYIITLDKASKNIIRIWSGLRNKYLYEKTTSNPRWFSDGKRLLVSVWGRAYKQSYDRGIYIINTSGGTHEGPLVKVAGGGLLGNNGEYFISNKYTNEQDPLNGNFIRYDFKTGNWQWITDFPSDSLNRWAKQPVPNPVGTELIFSRFTENAWQLFQMNDMGKHIRQITKMGGDLPRWSPDGDYVFFNRDVHKAPGAQYIPYSYEIATGNIQPLWPNLPDSVPQFPALASQKPADLYSMVRDSLSAVEKKE